jgi:hypothetical protein
MWREKLLWRVEEENIDPPLAEEELSELNYTLRRISDHYINYSYLPNVFHDRKAILQRLNALIPELENKLHIIRNELIPKYENWVREYGRNE